MTKIVLDTNIWIYLTKDTFSQLLSTLKEKKNSEEFEILVNEVIIKEWDRNKEKTLNILVDGIREEYKAAQKLAAHMEEPAKSQYLLSLSEYKNEQIRIKKAQIRIKEVENLMNSCKLIEVTDDQKLFISNLAIEKKPPFENNKNNFNDALIIRNICEFAEYALPSKYDLIYVSNNPDDFTDKKTGEVFSSIMEGLNPIRLKTVTQLGEALHLAPELIEDFDDWIDYHLEREIEYQFDLMRGK